jgi:hypothetical protein
LGQAEARRALMISPRFGPLSGSRLARWRFVLFLKALTYVMIGVFACGVVLTAVGVSGTLSN